MLTLGISAANVLGDLDRAQEFYNRARQRVSRFFDASDYTVAEALATMAYFAFGQVTSGGTAHQERAFSYEPSCVTTG